ncbi:MAG: hypothetical protein GIW94_08665 [Candidatus Eremiobacteraeota bacterium]|nr:hypothetical protein [Candidatus Eremiobacteraeota bacterium]MBC5822273.1 hypothetical protein [Candidatus Eremiobacteraeota bacterium]
MLHCIANGDRPRNEPDRDDGAAASGAGGRFFPVDVEVRAVDELRRWEETTAGQSGVEEKEARQSDPREPTWHDRCSRSYR